ncbi:AAA family ATPase [Aciditerrimonas ferrireducens]|jgi:DNA-binding SARP family transcriptional activator|uniref:AAA family ATPase n=1 Tax=Aciditerrimonas ferrireducens TaxID=667306 RepID=A0ABV6C2E8_9ACTN
MAFVVQDRGAGARRREIALLGEGRLSGDGGEATVSGHGAVVLACLLSNPDRALSTGDLADALWENDVPRSWRSIVRLEVSRLRRLLEDVLSAACRVPMTRLGYRVVLPEDTWVDLWAARDLVARAEAARAAGHDEEATVLAWRAEELLARPLLAGLERHWVARQRDRLDQLRRSALWCAVESAEASGADDRAVAALERLTGLEPLDEAVCRRLMARQLAQRNRAGALHTYARLRRRLREDLGVVPDETTEALYLQALGADPRAPATHAHLLEGQASSLVGRDAELELLAGTWRAAASGGSPLVIVRGEAGSGKTALLRAAAATPPVPGAAVLWAALGRSPLGLVDLVGAAGLPGPPCPALRRGQSADPHPGPPAGSAEPPLAEQVAGLVAFWRRLAGHHPTLVVLDDVHRARPEVRRALELLVHAEPVPGLALVLSAEPGTEDPTDGLLTLSPDRPTRVVHLGGLARDAVRTLASRAGLRPSATVVAELVERSGGNPGLLLAVLGGGPGPSGARPVPSLRDLLGARLARLAPEHRRLLGLAAGQGGAFDPLALAETGLASVETLESAVLAAERLGLVVRPFGSPQVVLAHHLLRDLLRAEAAPSWLASAGRPEQPPGSPDRNEQVTAPAPEWRHWLGAARAASARGDHRLAAEHAGRAVTVLETAGLAKGPAALRALLVWGFELAQAGDTRARPVLFDAAELALALSSPTQAAGALVAASASLVPTSVAGPDQRFENLARTVLRRRLAPAVRARLLVALAGELLWDRPLAVRQQLVHQACRLARATGDVQLAAEVGVAAHLATTWPGNLGARHRNAARLLHRARARRDATLELRARLFLADALLEGFALDQARAQLAAAELLASRLGRHFPWEVQVRQAGLALLTDGLEAAESAAQRAYDTGRQGGAPAEGVLAVLGAQLALIRFEQGRLGELASLLDALEDGRPPWVVWQVAECFALAEQGRGEEARRILGALAQDGFAGLVPNMAQLGSLTFLGLVAARFGDPTHCATLLELLHPYRHRLSWGLAVSAGPVGLAVGQLQARLDEGPAARRTLAATAARCRRVGATRWAARAEAALLSLPG